MSICYQDIWDDLPLIVGRDWCLSLGYQVRLMTNDPRVGELKASEEQWSAFAAESGDVCGYYASWCQNRLDLIVINAYQDGEHVGLTRIIELIAHEVSHMVDNYFARAHIVEIDTEVRAYMMDYFVGKLVHKWTAGL